MPLSSSVLTFQLISLCLSFPAYLSFVFLSSLPFLSFSSLYPSLSFLPSHIPYLSSLSLSNCPQYPFTIFPSIYLFPYHTVHYSNQYSLYLTHILSTNTCTSFYIYPYLFNPTPPVPPLLVLNQHPLVTFPRALANRGREEGMVGKW